jgi:hypothetical protein
MTSSSLLLGVQRWRERRDSYRPAGEVIDTSAYAVAPIAGDSSDNIARAFVLRHHYLGSYPSARRRFGLYRAGELVGVAVFSHPSNNRTLTNVFPGEATDSIELGRFVLLDGVPGNGETWFLARAFEHLRAEGFRGVVSFSDPFPRTTADGRVVHPGHVGTIYQAFNGRFLGRAKADTLRLFADGVSLNGRALAKLRAGVRGRNYVAELLESHGATARPDDPAELVAWCEAWLPKLTRPMRHPGNFKYAWALDRREHKRLASVAPYPKLLAA